MTNYGVLIYASLGLSGSIPLLLNACWTTFTIVGNTWTAFYVDRFGRRTFMLIGSCGCVVSVVFLCALTAQFLGTDNSNGLNAAVFFIWVCGERCDAEATLADDQAVLHLLVVFLHRCDTICLCLRVSPQAVRNIRHMLTSGCRIWPNHLRSQGTALGISMVCTVIVSDVRDNR